MLFLKVGCFLVIFGYFLEGSTHCSTLICLPLPIIRVDVHSANRLTVGVADNPEIL